VPIAEITPAICRGISSTSAIGYADTRLPARPPLLYLLWDYESRELCFETRYGKITLVSLTILPSRFSVLHFLSSHNCNVKYHNRRVMNAHFTYLQIFRTISDISPITTKLLLSLQKRPSCVPQEPPGYFLILSPQSKALVLQQTGP
jgi:hypothetical protein